MLNFKPESTDDIECEIASASWETPISTTLLVTLYKVYKVEYESIFICSINVSLYTLRICIWNFFNWTFIHYRHNEAINTPKIT